ncbi:MAG: tetratricopeptide repeat protein [Pyrinomonadaceae bacterium]|nr:tetratricopeptide repeat protein [Pyrinomonadaceae bacterium]
MRNFRTILQALITLVVFAVLAVCITVVAKRRLQPETAKPPEATAETSSVKLTPADRRIQAAQVLTESAPQKPEGYLQLCNAYMQKARETGDFGFNSRAEAALNRAVELEPENYDALKLRAKLQLTYHRFGEALETAKRALVLRPQDHDVYGALTDAHVELGNYVEAIKSAQRMVDLRPDTAAYSRVSYLRALHGDTAGAIEAMTVAAKAADPRDPESVAWCLVQLGDELMNAGKQTKAEQQYDAALAILPDYHLSLAAKGRARAAAGDALSAIDYYQKAQQLVPLPETAIALGDLYHKQGRAAEANKQYQLVEFIERSGAASGTYSRTLALFYADHDMKLDEALEIAQKERAARADIYTSDALAWCLFKKGRLAEAKTEIEAALRLKTRDARLFYHAGMIAHAMGEEQRAVRYLKLALEVNPSFDVIHADIARQTLAQSGERDAPHSSRTKG